MSQSNNNGPPVTSQITANKSNKKVRREASFYFSCQLVHSNNMDNQKGIVLSSDGINIMQGRVPTRVTREIMANQVDLRDWLQQCVHRRLNIPFVLLKAIKHSQLPDAWLPHDEHGSEMRSLRLT